MPEQIIDGTGSGNYLAGVTSNNRLMVDVGGDITISGVQFESITIQETSPIDDNKNNPAWKFEYMVSGTATGITFGSAIGSITQFIDAGSYVQTITYSNNNITNLGSWVGV